MYVHCCSAVLMIHWYIHSSLQLELLFDSLLVPAVKFRSHELDLGGQCDTTPVAGANAFLFFADGEG